MLRTVFLWLAATIWLLVVACAPSRPNVLLLTLDTTRADHLGAYASKFTGTTLAYRVRK